MKDQKEKELNAKEKEIIDLNEKYRVYLEKAKIVIKSLDPRNSNGINEIQYLKNQIIDKEKQIKQLMVIIIIILIPYQLFTGKRTR